MTSTLRRLCVAAVMTAALAMVATSVGTQSTDRPDRFSVASGRTLRARSEAVESMQRTRELRMRTVQEDSLIPGRRHERLDQYYKGVRVFGGEVVRETDGTSVIGVTGTVYGPVRVDTTPTLEPADAMAVFERETGPVPASAVTSELVILPKENGPFVLAYRLTAFVNQRLPVIFVNAKTGVVERRYENLRTQQPAAGIGHGVYGDEKKVSGTLQGTVYQAWDQMRPTRIVTYDLRGNVNRMLSRLTLFASDIATSPTSTWADGVVVDAHTYLGWTYDYFFKRHSWKGFDNRDSRAIHAIVHPVRREDMAKYAWSDVGMYYANAYFCAQCGSDREDIVMFGEGFPAGYYVVASGQYVNYHAASLDIVAHEYSHGVMAYTSDLMYQDEAGALDEAFSDIMATGVEFFLQPAGSGRLQADYLHGEETYLQGRPGSVAGSRSLADPSAFGDPDHYSKMYTGDDDNGGVHINSSIANHAFYLAVEGGTNRTSGLVVHGVGAANREQIEKVFFRGLTTLPSDSTFSQARAKTIQSARDLFSGGSAVERAVTEAWTAVGVQ